ncbi:MAG: dTMP kinase [Chloroflexia bacterium]|nr:dTMP kinase [Chloroflexia bacterium]MDQ3614624.1 dTMP kinase [Chloroflexota bacterium]
MRSQFIVFEGPEGGGKSTQIARLATHLTIEGHEVVVTREPGGTPVGDAIRLVLLERDDDVMLAETEAFLLSAARAQHVHDVIRPALRRGCVVLCDRYADSTRAYQGGGGGMSADDLECLQRIATGGLTPDLRLLLDLPVETGLARRHQDPSTVNRIDRAERAYHEQVRDAFLRLARAEPDSWTIIDASRSIDLVSDDVIRTVRAHLLDTV